MAIICKYFVELFQPWKKEQANQECLRGSISLYLVFFFLKAFLPLLSLTTGNPTAVESHYEQVVWLCTFICLCCYGMFDLISHFMAYLIEDSNFFSGVAHTEHTCFCRIFSQFLFLWSKCKSSHGLHGRRQNTSKSYAYIKKNPNLKLLEVQLCRT